MAAIGVFNLNVKCRKENKDETNDECAFFDPDCVDQLCSGD